MAKIAFCFEVQLDAATRRCPAKIILPLRQMPDVEGSEPRRGSKLQGAMLACLRLQSPPREIISTRRNHYSWRNLERHKQSLAVWVPVEFKTIAGFEADVNWSHEIFPRLYDA